MSLSNQNSRTAALLAKIFRILPISSGCGKISNKPFFRNLLKEPGPVWIRTREGLALQCYLDEYVGRSAYYFGDLDPKLSWILKTMLRPGDEFIDVGANIGILTFLGSQLVGETGKVLAVEPQPKINSCLEHAMEANGSSNITLARCGVGAQQETLTLHVPRGNLGSASFSQLSGDEVSTYEVPVTTLTELCRKHEFSNPRLVKLDVEEWEAEVVAGARESWQKNPPAAVIFEMREPSPIPETEVGRQMLALGYRFYRLPRHWFHPQIVRSDEGFSKAVTHDVFAVHSSQSCLDLGFSAREVIE